MTKLEYLKSFEKQLIRVFPEQLVKGDELAMGNLAYFIEVEYDSGNADKLMSEILCKDINEMCYVIISRIHQGYRGVNPMNAAMERQCYRMLEEDYKNKELDTFNLIGYDDFPQWYKEYISITHDLGKDI